MCVCAGGAGERCGSKWSIWITTFCFKKPLLSLCCHFSHHQELDHYFFSPFFTSFLLCHPGIGVASEVFKGLVLFDGRIKGATLLIPCLFSHPSSPPALHSCFPEPLTICWTNHNSSCLCKALPSAWILLPANSYISWWSDIKCHFFQGTSLDHPQPLFCASVWHLLYNLSPKHGVLTLPSYLSVNSKRAGIMCVPH